jgi:hypothetical protein
MRRVVTSGTIPVSAQWALHGKQPDGEDYRVLACSTGDLNRTNFADALSRFQLGELSTLPQVSISYARHGTHPGATYVALAIHWYPAEGEHYADGIIQRDNQGRRTAYTSYFCLPYQRLAAAAIGYLDIYEALRAVTLPLADGPAIEVPIALPSARTPGANDLAVRVAPLLLTGKPVCVLGAEDVGMPERLQFISAVMDLLPYGFRSRMAAATLTRATHRNHRFRLFFSSTPRADERGQVVAWGGDPALIPVPAGEPTEYFEWLQDSLGPLSRLAELTNEVGFGPKDTLQAVESALGTKHRFSLRPRWGAPPAGGLARPPAMPPVPAPLAQANAVRQALIDCAENVNRENQSRVRSDVNHLKKLSEAENSESFRAQHQDTIAQLRLLRADLPIEDKYRDRLYGALLRLGFGAPLTYQAYCSVERCAGIARGAAPDQYLLAAIVKSEVRDPLVNAIVHWHLDSSDERKLNKWLTSGQIDVIRLIEALAALVPNLQHARIICEVTLRCLAKEPEGGRPQQTRAVLQQHGFLARALQRGHPEEDQYQFDFLYRLLTIVYPQPAVTPGQELSQGAIRQILSGPTGPPPTPALLGAVLNLLHRPQSRELAFAAYVEGSLIRPNFDDRTRAYLYNRLPPLDAAMIGEPEQRLAEPISMDDEMTQQLPSGPRH